MAKNFFQTHNKEEQSSEMLFLWMKSALREGTLEKEENNLQSLSKNSSINESAQYESLKWLSLLAVRNDDYDKAMGYALSVPNSSLKGREIYFDIASEIMQRSGNIAKASQVLDKASERYNDAETLREKQFVLNLYSNNLNLYRDSSEIKPPVTENNTAPVILNDAYPNPFNPTTLISYSITKPGFVTLKILDILGREVTTLVNEEKMPGTYSVNFNGDRFASGIYFYSLITNGKIITKKMLLIK
ncbi:MAG: T9SS type A sorting domain-containing protein [Ignavibacteriaceae bacterium]